MKILLIQLLRLGDVIAIAPVLTALKEKYPKAEIHIMVNKEAEKVLPLFQDVHVHWVIDRKNLQEGLGRPARALFEPYDRLKEVIDQINAQNYGLIINATQNRFSARLMGLLRADKKVGLEMRGDQLVFGSPWIQYLNKAESVLAGRFHYTDVFKFAVEVDETVIDYGFSETERGASEVRSLTSQKEKIILIQPFTSDSKKNWPEEKFLRLIQLLEVFFPLYRIGLLGAPFERDRVEGLIERLRPTCTSVFSAILSLEGAYSLIRRSELLVSGDTSIKHLAASLRTPVIELSLGSSDCYTTGPYSDRALVIRSRESCHPCVHSKACHREKHFCSERLSPELVAMTVQAMIYQDHQSLRKIANDFSNDVDILLTRISHSGYWYLENLSQIREDEQLTDLLSKISWRQMVQPNHTGLTIVGNECFAVQESVTSSELVHKKLKRRAFLERKLNWLKSELGRLVVSSDNGEHWSQLEMELRDFLSQLDESEAHYLVPLKTQLEQTDDRGFLWVKECRKRVDEMILRREIEEKALHYFAEALGN